VVRSRWLRWTNCPFSVDLVSLSARDLRFVSERVRTARIDRKVCPERIRIGNVYRVPPEAAGLAYSAFQIGIHMRDALDADFAYWMLRNPQLQRTVSENERDYWSRQYRRQGYGMEQT
jgi:hypothetical protein